MSVSFTRPGDLRSGARTLPSTCEKGLNVKAFAWISVLNRCRRPTPAPSTLVSTRLEDGDLHPGAPRAAAAAQAAGAEQRRPLLAHGQRLRRGGAGRGGAAAAGDEGHRGEDPRRLGGRIDLFFAVERTGTAERKDHADAGETIAFAKGLSRSSINTTLMHNVKHTISDL